jgi:hypothetical protein
LTLKPMESSRIYLYPMFPLTYRTNVDEPQRHVDYKKYKEE